MDARGSRRLSARFGVVVCAVLALAGACAQSDPEPVPATKTPSPTSSVTERVSSPPVEPTVERVEVRYRVERRTDDAATDGFAETVRAILEDPRGWGRAGFDLVHDPDAEHVVVLAEGPEVDELCAPYDTRGRYSCQIGSIVALNADRWRTATPEFTGDLETYRTYLVSHEVGHLLGLHHPTPQCPAERLPAAVMSQQSTELGGCLPNGWPLDWEIGLAARHEEPLAPGYEPDPSPRPTDPRAEDASP